MIQTIQQAFVHKFAEKFHFFRGFFEDEVDDVFYHVLCQLHVVLKVGKSDLRLDHPELGCVSCGVGVFCPESRSECIYVAESHGKSFSFQLSAYCQVSFFPEKIAAVVYPAILCPRQVVEVQCRHLEHLSCAFGIAACDYRRVDIDKIPVLEKFMDRIGYEGSDSENC